MLRDKLKNKQIILGSGSPRRKFFLEELGLDFEIRLKEVEENFPETLVGSEITDYLATLKSKPFLKELKDNDLLITADTIVWLDNRAIGKPKNSSDAKMMLSKLSGNQHKVISTIAITTNKKTYLINDTTSVTFKPLSNAEINYYIEHFKPFDKAGSYGIQEWIGYIGIERIEGNFFNVMGFPVQKFYELMMKISIVN
jgi:septum formation protein